MWEGESGIVPHNEEDRLYLKLEKFLFLEFEVKTVDPSPVFGFYDKEKI